MPYEKWMSAISDELKAVIEYMPNKIVWEPSELLI